MAKTTKTPPRQIREFKKAAREFGCDEATERFDAALKAVGKHKPKAEAKAAKKR